MCLEFVVLLLEVLVPLLLLCLIFVVSLLLVRVIVLLLAGVAGEISAAIQLVGPHGLAYLQECEVALLDVCKCAVESGRPQHKLSAFVGKDCTLHASSQHYYN